MSLSLFKLGRADNFNTECEHNMVDLKKQPKPRIEYLSKSKNSFIDIETMNDHHLMNAIRRMVMDTAGAEFRIVHETHAEKAYVTSTITEVEIVTE